MKKPPRGLVISVVIPFLVGCFRVQPQPLPEPDARRSVDVRGVVLAGSGDGERVEFVHVDRVEWTDSTVVFTGVLRGSDMDVATTRSYPLASLSGVLVRQVDANRTSIIIGAFAVGALAAAALLITGKGDGTTVLNASGRD